MTRTNMKLGCVAVALLAGAMSASADYVILANDTRIEGKDARRKSDGTVRIVGAAGAQEFAKNQYKIAVCEPPPPEFIAGAQALKTKNYQEAITQLEKAADDKQGLEIDKTARGWIARAYAGLNKAGEGVSQFDKLARIYGPEVLKEPSVAVEYAGALLAAKQSEKLGAVLDDIIKDAPRNVAAKAQNLRGQMREGQGQLDAALLDYMRTAHFFAKDGGEATAEGLYRAAKILDSRKDPRAKILYKRIADEYKDSPFAKEAAGKV